MNAAPSLPSHIKTIRRDGKVIFINPSLPRWIVTDDVGALVIELFTGNNSVDDIVNIAVEGLGESKRNQIKVFCEKVLASGLMDNIPWKQEKHRMQLSSVHLSLSDACNLNCSYCYARERVEGKFSKLSFDEYKVIIDDILTINPNVVFTLTGGEPLLNKDCFRIAAYIKEKGAQVYLLSNGTLFSEKNAPEIARLFDLVTISIDGPNERVHSLTRGHNFDKVMAAVALLDKYNVDYTLSMTVTQKNISYIEETARLFGNRLNFAPYFPVSGEPSKLAITGEMYFNALKSAAGVRPLSYCESSLDASKVSQCHKCAIGDGEFSISATGDVYPCQLLHVDEFYAGNTHELSIVDIYYHAKTIDYCSHLDVDTIKGCSDCAFKYICGGGCRARAYYECGDINSSSDFCIYEQEAFIDGILALYSTNGVSVY